VLVDVAVMLAGGGEAIADIDVLRHQSQVLGPVASASTVWRTLDELTPARLKQIDSAPGAGASLRVVSVARWVAGIEGRRHRPGRGGGARCGRHDRGVPQ
jgi:hypothetical protein